MHNVYNFVLGRLVAKNKISKAQRDETRRHLKAGKGASQVSAETGLPRSAVAKVKNRSIRDSAAVTTGSKVMSVRLTEAERDGFEALKERFGFSSNSNALRGIVRIAIGMLEFEPELAAELIAVKAELQKIGVNVNQIALAANRGRIDLMPPDWESLKDLKRTIPQVRMVVDGVVDEHRRRGTRLFRQWQEAGNG